MINDRAPSHTQSSIRLSVAATSAILASALQPIDRCVQDSNLHPKNIGVTLESRVSRLGDVALIQMDGEYRCECRMSPKLGSRKLHHFQMHLQDIPSRMSNIMSNAGIEGPRILL
jgi:hypothetical protein